MSLLHSVPPRASGPTDPGPQDAPDGHEDEGRVAVLPLINLLLRHLNYILKATAYLLVVVFILSWLIPPTYTATAQFLSSDKFSSGSSSKEGGVQAAPSIASLPEYYKTLLQSEVFIRSAVQRLAANEKIIEDEQADFLKRIVAEIKNNVTVTNTQSAVGNYLNTVLILALQVTNADPDLAVKINNTLLDELSAYSGGERTQRAIQNRDFIQHQLDFTETELHKYEDDLATFSMLNRKIVTPDLKTEKDRLERAVKVQEGVFLALRKELEMAKIKVQEDVTILQVLERPTAAVKTGPKRIQILLVTGMLGLFLFSLQVFTKDHWIKMDREDKEVQEFIHHVGNIRLTFDNMLISARGVTENLLAALIIHFKSLKRRLSREPDDGSD